MQGLTDDDLMEALLCGIRFHYALYSISLEEQPASDRTFNRFCLAYYKFKVETGRDLIKEEMISFTERIVNYFDLNLTQKRMDSMMIASNTRKLSGLELLYQYVVKFIYSLDTSYPSINITNFKHYLNLHYENIFIYHNDTPYNDKLCTIRKDGSTLLDIFRDELFEQPEFQLLCCAIEDQTTKNDEGEPIIKKGKEVCPDNL